MTSSAWNIPDDIYEMGETFGLKPIGTGGNIDYMENASSTRTSTETTAGTCSGWRQPGTRDLPTV